MRMRATLVLLLILLAGCGNIDRGEQIARDLGCGSCHGAGDGIGPSWTGKLGSTRLLADGSTVLFDEGYVRRSITNPGAELVAGYDAIMPAFSLSTADEDALVRYVVKLAGS